MLSSLFGDLAPRRIGTDPAGAGEAAPVGATPCGAAVGAAAGSPDALHDSVAAPQRTTPAIPGANTSVTATDVVVDASPAQAMRAHFAARRGAPDAAMTRITLLDPSRLWAAQVIEALSAATGQGVERVNLRERGTLRTLAVIERTTVPRHGAQALKVYHADIRATGLEHDEIANALAEGSGLTAVIVGALQPYAVVALLRSLLLATRQPEWHCPWLLFILPPGAAALRQRILDQDWPAAVRTAAMTESLGTSSTVWNTVLTAWEAAAASAQANTAPGDPTAPPALLPALTQRALALMLRTEGLLACGIVDLASGVLLAAQTRTGAATTELGRVAQAMQAARRAHQAALGPGTPLADELLLTAGSRQSMLRALPHGSAIGIVALVDRAQANLALLRFRMLDAEQYLV